jgi:hypothetical protein
MRAKLRVSQNHTWAWHIQERGLITLKNKSVGRTHIYIYIYSVLSWPLKLTRPATDKRATNLEKKMMYLFGMLFREIQR